MTYTKTASPDAQLSMPGMPTTELGHAAVKCCGLTPGEQVLYLGNVGGGPRHGSRGTVKRTLLRRAVVDMDRAGTWHIPYHFLATMEAA